MHAPTYTPYIPKKCSWILLSISSSLEVVGQHSISMDCSLLAILLAGVSDGGVSDFLLLLCLAWDVQFKVDDFSGVAATSLLPRTEVSEPSMLLLSGGGIKFPVPCLR